MQSHPCPDDYLKVWAGSSTPLGRVVLVLSPSDPSLPCTFLLYQWFARLTLIIIDSSDLRWQHVRACPCTLGTRPRRRWDAASPPCAPPGPPHTSLPLGSMGSKSCPCKGSQSIGHLRISSLLSTAQNLNKVVKPHNWTCGGILVNLYTLYYWFSGFYWFIGFYWFSECYWFSGFYIYTVGRNSIHYFSRLHPCKLETWKKVKVEKGMHHTLSRLLCRR